MLFPIYQAPKAFAATEAIGKNCSNQGLRFLLDFFCERPIIWGGWVPSQVLFILFWYLLQYRVYAVQIHQASKEQECDELLPPCKYSS